MQFDPREGKANGKEVRNVVVRQSGVHEKEAVRVSCTIWPTHAHAPIKKGDFVAFEGKFTQNTGQDSNGAPVVYNNLSVFDVAVNGTVYAAQKPGVENAVEPETDEDVPF